jgi:hypothetical protein
MFKKGTEDLKLDRKLKENFRSLSEFWEKNFKPDNFLALDTARRAIYAKEDVSLNMLMVLMHALGYSRPQIVDALKDRGDTWYWRLIEPAESGEADLPVPDRRLLEDVREIRSGNRSLHNALMTIIHAVRSVTPSMLAASGNTLLHVLAGTKIDPALRQEFEQAVERRLKDPAVDVNARNEYGATPFLYACMAQNEEIAVALIEAGADVTLEDTDGTTALYYVEKHRLGRVAEVLKKTHSEYVLDYWLRKSGSIED